jgi:hypothetical protein
MPEPISLCLEELDLPPEQTRFIRCVALSGAEPGLGLDARGKALWRGSSADARACELWVSADERLILWRSLGAPDVTVRRARRSLDVPAEKAVVMLDQDELELAGVRLRLHVHGPTTEIYPPTPFLPRAVGAAALAAAVALGGAVAGCHREEASPDPGAQLPTATATSLEPQAASAAASGSTADAGAAASASATTPVPATATATAKATGSAKTPPIEVRPHPPKPVANPADRNGF